MKTGTVRASELIRSLLRSDKPSAIVDLGRITKPLYFLAYIDDETYRVLTQLNRQEARHSLARAVFTDGEGKCASAIARDRRTNSAHSGTS